jgi:hypothetical protein
MADVRLTDGDPAEEELRALGVEFGRQLMQFERGFPRTGVGPSRAERRFCLSNFGPLRPSRLRWPGRGSCSNR